MKKFVFTTALLLITICLFSQKNGKIIRDSTRTPLKGTFIKNGKIYLSPGYKVTYSEDKTLATISRQNGNGISGSFSCSCGVLSNKKCSVTSTDGAIYCDGESCCGLVVTTNSSNLAITSTSGNADGNITWKVLVIPKTNTSSTSN